jgi:hypothetical protein
LIGEQVEALVNDNQEAEREGGCDAPASAKTTEIWNSVVAVSVKTYGGQNSKHNDDEELDGVACDPVGGGLRVTARISVYAWSLLHTKKKAEQERDGER